MNSLWARAIACNNRSVVVSQQDKVQPRSGVKKFATRRAADLRMQALITSDREDSAAQMCCRKESMLYAMSWFWASQ